MDIRLTPTQHDFVFSGAEIPALIGPMGEGKTYAGGARILIRASQLPKGETLRGAIIRDTGPNLEQHTIPSLQQAFGSISRFGAMKSGGWKWIGPRLEAVMFGIDSLSDLSRLQGPEWDFIWIEEPAPILGGTSAGVSEEVFDVGLSRLRGGLRKKWLQVTMNPASEEHWTYRKFESEIDSETKVFHIPYRENLHLSDPDRARVMRAFRNRPDLAARYVKGLWGSVQVGEAVTPEYSEAMHRSAIPLSPLPISSAMRFWDGWHNPTCLIVQRSPNGRLFFLDTIRGDNMGVQQLIETQVKSIIQQRYSHIREWADHGDESMRTPDQSDRSTSASGKVERLLGARFNPIGNGWDARRESMKTLLNTMIDGEPMVSICRGEKVLHAALKGGWHYPKNASGVVGDMPVKDMHSHPGDAFSYSAVTVMPWAVPVRVPRIDPKAARSYAVR